MLIEAGGEPASRFVSIPAGFPKLFRSELDWAFESEPQAAVGGRRIFTPRGRMLGGSSNLNAQIHQWCHPADFDGWAAAGAAGWSWNEVAPVFREQEALAAGSGGPDRGRGGPMRIAPNRNARPLSHRFVAAARSLGLGGATEYNGAAYEGAWIPELAHHRGRRFSVYDAYLRPARRRQNLDLLAGVQAVGVKIEEGRARGVRVRRGGVEELFEARGVVLAAGAFGSPHLLMHSGIGPADVLTKVDLAVRFEAPEVGRNLQDHPLLPLTFRSSTSDTMKCAESIASLLRYLLFGRGMLASNGVEAFAFTQVEPGHVAAPDLELIFVPFEFRKEFLEAPREHAFSIGAAVVAPRSRGQIWLRGPDPLAAPAIDFGLLSDPDGVDARVLLAGARLARRIATTEPLAELHSGPLLPEESVRSDAELLDFAAAALQTVYHPTSTCRMGTDGRSVVDPQLRVRGVDGLWVVDASVMPAVPRGHPNAVVAMIADRAARWVELALLA